MSKKEAAEKYFKLGEQKYNKKDYQEAIADYPKDKAYTIKSIESYYYKRNANRGSAKDSQATQRSYCRLRQSHTKPKNRCLLQPRQRKKMISSNTKKLLQITTKP